MNKKTLTKVSERYEAPSLEILSVSMEGQEYSARAQATVKLELLVQVVLIPKRKVINRRA